MELEITGGNAIIDGSDFQQWFVGDIQKWCEGKQVAFNPLQVGLRNTPSIEIKWGTHSKGQQRPGGWAARSNKITLSLLLRGALRLWFRSSSQSASEREHRLIREGDYVIWSENVEHFWIAEQESIVLTMRWVAN